MQSDGDGITCPCCGAPVDVRARSTDSGWVELPPMRDLARIHFNRSTCQVSGAYVPVAEMALDPSDSVFFSHHVLLHAEPGVRLEAMQMGSGWNRRLAGMPLVMVLASGPGHLALSADHPGETIAVPLPPGSAVDVVEHRFLAGTTGVDYRWESSGIWFQTGTGDDTETHYPLGMTMDLFFAQQAPGLLLLHAPGNVFLRDLAPGEQILVQPSSLLWKDRSVRLHLHLEVPAGTYWFSSASRQGKTVWLACTGPGRIAVQSVFERPETVGQVTGGSPFTSHHWDPSFAAAAVSQFGAPGR
jgi:uncharacterized protein (AIM24 family)